MPNHNKVSKTAALALFVGVICLGKGIEMAINNKTKSEIYILHGTGLVAMAGIAQHTKKIGMK